MERNNVLLKCFCEARKTQAFFTQCLNKHSSEEERRFLLDLVQESAKTANKIREYCIDAANRLDK